MMKILYFAETFRPATRGGVAAASFHLCRELALRGVDIRVITTDRDGKDGRFHVNKPLNTWITHDNLPVVYCKTWPGLYLFSPSMMALAEVEAQKCDVIISSATCWDYAGWLANRLALKYKKPHVVYPHGVFAPWGLRFKKYRKQLYWHLIGKNLMAKASRIIALTDIEQNALRQLGIKTPITIIPNGIDPGYFLDNMSRKDLEEIYPQLKGHPFLLYMSRLHAVKGLDILLPAFEKAVSDADDDLCLVIAGYLEDIYQHEFGKLLRSCRSQNILLVGHVTGKLKNSLLRYALGFILTSYTEGLSVAVLEALSLGCPVIISQQCNLPEVGQANAGWVVPTSIEEVSQAIVELSTDKETTKIKGKNAKNLVKERFSWDIIAKSTIEALNLSIAEHGSK